MDDQSIDPMMDDSMDLKKSKYLHIVDEEHSIRYEFRVFDKIQEEVKLVTEKLEMYETHCLKSFKDFLNLLNNNPIQKVNQEPLLGTPSSAKKISRKRAAPTSSATRKILIHRSKRANFSNENNINNVNGTLQSTNKNSARRLFTQKSFSKMDSVDSVGNHNFNELMTELSIDNKPSNDTKFIATENSLLKKNLTKMDSTQSSIIKTRSQTRLASNTVKAVNDKDTPKKYLTSDRNKNANCSLAKVSTKGKSVVGTPKQQKLQSNTTYSTPMQQKREELEARKKLLLSSEDKKKKADVNRQIYLENKKMALKTRLAERDKRLARFKENQRVAEMEKQANMKRKLETAPAKPPPTAFDNTQHNSNAVRVSTRQLERKKKLANLSSSTGNIYKKTLRKDDISTNSKATTTFTKKATATNVSSTNKALSSSTGTLNNKQHLKHVDSVVNSKVCLESNKEKLHAELLTSDESIIQVDTKEKDLNIEGDIVCNTFLIDSAISPFKKPTLNNTTFTSDVDFAHPALLDTTQTKVLNSTNIQFNTGTSIVNLPTSMPINQTMNKTITKLQTSINNYEMTPPPKPVPSYSNYDISAFIDSDDEDADTHNDHNSKPIPKWAQGKEFINLLKEQFSLPPDELNSLVKKIFPHDILLPVPLEQMGLTVRPNYAVRSSSVSWNKLNK